MRYLYVLRFFAPHLAVLIGALSIFVGTLWYLSPERRVEHVAALLARGTTKEGIAAHDELFMSLKARGSKANQSSSCLLSSCEASVWQFFSVKGPELSSATLEVTVQLKPEFRDLPTKSLSPAELRWIATRWDWKVHSYLSPDGARSTTISDTWDELNKVPPLGDSLAAVKFLQAKRDHMERRLDQLNE